MNEVSHHAMTMALDFLRNDATVTVDGLISTATKIREFLDGAANEAASAEDAPKARRRTAAKTTGETETGTASESAPSDKPALVAADEPAQRREGVTDVASKIEATEPKTVDDDETVSLVPAVDRDTAMARAIKFSQVNGDAALEDALKAVGSVDENGKPRFSLMPADKYAAFVKVMDEYVKPSSALS